MQSVPVRTYLTGIFLFLLWGCTAGQGDTPSPAPTLTATFTQAPVATATATQRPTATPWPTATPVPKPVWGSMWEEVPCSRQIKEMPEIIKNAGSADVTWHGLLGQRLAPIPIGEGNWIPLRYNLHHNRGFSDAWASDEISVVDTTEPSPIPIGLEPTLWGGIGYEFETKWLEEEERYQYLASRAVVYDWVTKRIYCLRWQGGGNRSLDLGVIEFLAGPEGVMLWDSAGGKMYGLEGRGLEVAWEAPYESPLARPEAEQYENIYRERYWTGEVWNLFIRAQTKNGREEWSTEGYDVATGAHQYVQLSPRPWGAWKDWMWADIKYSWDNRRLALLQKYNPTNEFRILVYPLGECQESGEALCEPKVYPLNEKYLDWERPCQWPGQMFWSPEGDTLYFSILGISPYGIWKSWCQEREIQIWKLDVTRDSEGWEQVEVKPTEALLREAKRQGTPTRLGSTSWGGIAWDAEGKRLLVRVPRGDDYHYYVYAWLYLEPDDESKKGVMEPMSKEEVPFGLMLPWSFAEERGW